MNIHDGARARLSTEVFEKLRPLTSGNTALSGAIGAARRSAWLSRQPPEFSDALLSHATIQKFGGGEAIISLEETGSALYFLLEGAVEVSVPRANLELTPVHIILPWHWFGEHGAVTGNSNYAEYRARTPGSALVVSQRALASLEASAPGFREAALELLSLSIRNHLELAGDLMSIKVEGRVRSKLFTLSGSIATSGKPPEPHIVVPICQEELAILCCASRATAGKILRQLEQDGIIEIGYRKILVLHRNGLIANAVSA